MEIQETTPESKFTGGLLGLIGINIAVLLIIVITLGIGTPWAVCLKQNWVIRHTILDGKRLKFDGTGGKLFMKYIVWWIFTVITLGIYSLWLGIKMKQWVVSHTHHA